MCSKRLHVYDRFISLVQRRRPRGIILLEYGINSVTVAELQRRVMSYYQQQSRVSTDTYLGEDKLFNGIRGRECFVRDLMRVQTAARLLCRESDLSLSFMQELIINHFRVSV